MDTIVWSAAAMCMVPMAETVSEDKYVTTGGRVKFKVGQSGLIAFATAVTIPLPKGQYRLIANFESREPVDFKNKVVSLRRALRLGGYVETIISVSETVTVASDDVCKAVSSPITLEVNLDEYYYWVSASNKSETPASNDNVDALLGVGLMRVG